WMHKTKRLCRYKSMPKLQTIPILRLSYHRLNQVMILEMKFLYSRSYIFVEVEAKHIPYSKVIIIKIS
ncbi:MAG: hypothetical protein MR328_06515, partial [Firmicutes bacterium]|nr:hypothetical protein [Bacillota bacterium]